MWRGTDRLLRLITPATELAVTLEDAKAHLRVEDSESDALITAYIGAAQGQLSYLGRAFKPASYALDMTTFLDRVELPIAPVKGITAIKARDYSGTQTTVATSDYSLFVRANGIGEVRLASGQDWPSIRGDLGSASIEFTAGYDTVPDELRAAVLLITGRLFDERTDSTPSVGRGQVRGSLPILGPVDNLVAHLRVPGV